MISLKESPQLPLGEKKLSVAEFYDAFERLASKANASFVKVERLQSYDESGTDYHDAFTRGEKDRAVELFRKQFKSGSACEDDFCRRGISSERIRLIELPLSDYLKWELLTYRVTAQFGQRILFCDITQDSSRSTARTSSDFLMFDNNVVLRHDYSESGALQGAFLIDAPDEVRRYIEFVSSCRARSVSLGSFESDFPHLFE